MPRSNRRLWQAGPANLGGGLKTQARIDFGVCLWYTGNVQDHRSAEFLVPSSQTVDVTQGVVVPKAQPLVRHVCPQQIQDAVQGGDAY